MKKITTILIAVCTLALVSCNSNAQSSKTEKLKPTNMENKLPEDEKSWKEKLNDEQYYVLREKGTERPFTGKFYLHNDKGTYTCAGCGEPLFTSEMKFDSKCGWPSFDKEIKGGKIIKNVDKSHGMIRTEIVCAKCGGHLGHIFDDGPTETGERYCVNSLSLEFVPVDKK